MLTIRRWDTGATILERPEDLLVDTPLAGAVLLGAAWANFTTKDIKS